MFGQLRPKHKSIFIYLNLFLFGWTAFILSLLSPSLLWAHAVAQGDKGYIQAITGIQLSPFVYLGAKHMVTGYDHILFLLGVIFFLYRMKEIALYVSLFAIGHSSTMLLGVYFNIGI
ncbi:MAG: HupE/UreJ family protein, partial [bacterium]